MKVHKCVIKLTRTVANNMSDHEFNNWISLYFKDMAFLCKK